MAWTPWGRLRDRVHQIEERLRALEASDATREAAFLSARDQLRRVLDRWRKREDRDAEKGQGAGGPETVQAGSETETSFEKAQRRILARRSARAATGFSGALPRADDVHAEPARPDDE